VNDDVGDDELALRFPLSIMLLEKELRLKYVASSFSFHSALMTLLCSVSVALVMGTSAMVNCRSLRMSVFCPVFSGSSSEEEHEERTKLNDNRHIIPMMPTGLK
jgi:hypothetical protein